MFIINCDDFVLYFYVGIWEYHALCCTLILSCCTLCLAYIRGGIFWPTYIRRSDVPVSVESGRYMYSNLPVSCSYLIISWVLPTWYHLLYAHLCSSWFANWLSHHTRLGSFIWLPWILMSRSWSLERVDSPSCWSEWRSGSVDLQQTVQSSILPGPLVRL